MPFDRNRRRLLKTLASATVASAAGAVTPIAPAWAQNPAPRPGSPRLTFSRVVAGIEPILHRSGLMLRDLPAAPAIRVSSAVDLVYLSAITAYPADVDPWNPGSFRVPSDLAAEQKLLTDNIDRMLATAGTSWNNIVLLAVTGEVGPGSSMRKRLGDWRPCRTMRAVRPEFLGPG